jgi:hypothetical protein
MGLETSAPVFERTKNEPVDSATTVIGKGFVLQGYTKYSYILYFIYIYITNCNWAYARWQCYINNGQCVFLFIYCIFTIYSRYIKRVISKRDGCAYLKQVPSIDGSLELI